MEKDMSRRVFLYATGTSLTFGQIRKECEIPVLSEQVYNRIATYPLLMQLQRTAQAREEMIKNNTNLALVLEGYLTGMKGAIEKGARPNPIQAAKSGAMIVYHTLEKQVDTKTCDYKQDNIPIVTKAVRDKIFSYTVKQQVDNMNESAERMTKKDPWLRLLVDLYITQFGNTINNKPINPMDSASSTASLLYMALEEAGKAKKDPGSGSRKA